MRILVIDDDPKISKFIKLNLEMEFFAVDVAADGEKGIFWGCCNDYDLIILDNVLPKKSGLEVCREIRKKKKGVKIIMLSAIADVGMKTSLLDSGADDYMAKPFSFSELLARIKALLRRSNAVASDIIRIGELVINVGSNEVSKKGKIINLTRKEFMILEYLAKNFNRTLSQLDIMEHVWDMELDSFSNTLKTHIGSLRKKIDAKNKKSFIETVNGRGYKMVGT
jgi:DNA-binding response OmpR family regulator